MPQFKISRRLRLTPIVSLVSAGVLLVAGLAMGIYEDSLYRAQKAGEVQVQARILAASETAALVFSDTKAAQEYVNALQLNPEVAAAAVYGPSGPAIAGFFRPDLPPLPAQGLASGPLFQSNYIVVGVPVVQDNATVGTVYLRVIAESLQRRLARYGGMMFLAIMAALVLGVAASAQAMLARVNRALETQARDLAAANQQLQTEMRERERAEEALRQGMKMEAIGQLSGGIAHDFNNLITIIKGNLQLMGRHLAKGQLDVQRYIDSANDALNRAAVLTQRILAFSRRQPLTPQTVNLNRLIETMGEFIRHSVGERVTIETDLKGDWWTLCDATQMETVILNLALNARDAMPDGGRLAIRTKNVTVTTPIDGFDDFSPGDFIQLSVEDTGLGMSEEVRRRAIDPFFTTKPPGRGTGLGLSMAFGYVRQSNGYLKIDSKPGEGTTVTILMPRAIPETVTMIRNGTDADG